MLTLPTTRKTTAKVQPGCGVKINSIYYWSDAFRNPKVEGIQVPVRYDPFDAGLAFAFALGQWQECFSEHRLVFRNRSERELMLASSELRRRQTLHSRQFGITALKLAQFLESVEAEEVLLRQQQADYEQRSILALVSGETESCHADSLNPMDTSSNSHKTASSESSEESDQIFIPKKYEEF
jgi:hypothetical protein